MSEGLNKIRASIVVIVGIFITITVMLLVLSAFGNSIATIEGTNGTAYTVFVQLVNDFRGQLLPLIWLVIVVSILGLLIDTILPVFERFR